MINFYDSEIKDILPESLKTNEVLSISYAIRNANRKLINFTKASRLYTAIDLLPEKVLDLLAIELRTQYYEDTLDIKTKRQLIFNTIQWYKKSGTVSAVKDMLYTIFKTGDIEEWFEYGGEPFTFKITTDEVLTIENMTKFVDVIDKVKNARSKIEGFNKSDGMSSTIYYGSALSIVKCIRIG